MYFFLADSHFFHNNIIKYSNRPFYAGRDLDPEVRADPKWRPCNESVQLMDDTLIDNINRVVKPDDVLFHLGDFAYGIKSRYFDVCKGYRDRIRCRTIHFLRGNHDPTMAKVTGDPFDQRPVIYPLFTTTAEARTIELNGVTVRMSHYAHATWERSHRGSWCIFGHSHSSLEPWLDHHMPQSRQMDVGVDNAYKLLGEYRPFSFDEIKQLLGTRSGYAADHHV